MRTGRFAPGAAILPSGKVLVVGGLFNNNDTASALDSAELYDPSSGTWSSAGPMIGKRAQHIAVLLASDRVLVAGGTGETGNEVKSAEVYMTAQADLGDFMRGRKSFPAVKSKP